MSKSTKVISVIIFLITILIIIGLVCSYNSEPNGTSELLKNCLQVATCFVACLSLVFTVDARNENIILKNKDKKLQLELEWYDSIVLKRHLDDVLSFFENSHSFIEKFKEINVRHEIEDLNYSMYSGLVKKEVVQPFTQEYIKLQQTIVTDASIVDDNLANQLNSAFSLFQDDFTSYIQNTKPNYEEMKSVVLNAQKKIIKIIKDYNIDIIDPVLQSSSKFCVKSKMKK